MSSSDPSLRASGPQPGSPLPQPASARPADRQGLAILLMCLVSLIFAVQDALARHLGAAYSPVFVTMVRYWFFGLFVLAMAARGPGACEPPPAAAARSFRSRAGCCWSWRSSSWSRPSSSWA